MAITQLAIEYCNALVDDSSLRSSFFPGFNFSASASSAFDTTGLNQVISPIISNFVGDNVSTQPNDSDIETELTSLIDRLDDCGSSCASDRTETIVKAACTAVLGSAVILIQ